MIIKEILQRAATHCGYRREAYGDKNLPVDFSDVNVFYFFGDLRSAFILSGLLLKRWLHELYPSKYWIICGHAGWHGLFSFAQEYWSPVEFDFKAEALGFTNLLEKRVLAQEKLLNRHFEKVYSYEDMCKFYQNGLTPEYFRVFKDVKLWQPALPMDMEFSKKLSLLAGQKVIIYPQRKLQVWFRNKLITCPVRQDFWEKLAINLLAKQIVPICLQDSTTYDLSPLLEGRSLYLTDDNILHILGQVRAVGCVLDIFQGSCARLAALARVPFLVMSNRQYYNELREQELDLLTCKNIAHQYIFSFPTLIESGNDDTVIANIVKKLGNFLLTSANRDSWVSGSERDELVSYTDVKVQKLKRLGTKFIKIGKFYYE